MNEAIVCQPIPVKTLGVSRAPLRELLNFLIYSRHPGMLTERARRQPSLTSEKIPSTVKELKGFLRAEYCDKNEKLFFDCGKSGYHAAVLLDNQGAQFWVHYFRSGIGLVSLSFFSRLSSAEGAHSNQIRNVTHSHEYQWFMHDLPAEFFGNEKSEAKIKRLGEYFVERVNPTLVNRYSIRLENSGTKEPYKFISGNLERLEKVLLWACLVCESLKREREPDGKVWVNPRATIHCGNLKDAPAFEHSTETFINAVGKLAVKENAPYTVLREGFGRREGGECYDWARKKKHWIFINLEREVKESPAREKIVARARLVNWLAGQGGGGERILEIWKLKLTE